MSTDILEQVIDDIKKSPAKISLQLDEYTYVANCSQVLTLVRYVKDSNVEKHFLFCQALKTTTKAVDVFNMIKNFFTKHDLDQCFPNFLCK